MEKKALTLAPDSGPENQHAIDLFNRADERAIINLVPPQVQSAMLDSAKRRPDLFNLDEKSLYKTLKQEECTPTPTDNRLRLAFWMEYDRAQTTVKDMVMTNVVSGVCTRDYFYGNYLKHPEKISWLLCPIVSYEVKMREALDFGIDRLRDILELPYIDEKGRINTKILDLQAKIISMLDQRVKGSVLQKNMNLNVMTTDKVVAEMALGSTMGDLDTRIRELQARERRALNLPDEKKADTIEVESTTVTEDE